MRVAARLKDTTTEQKHAAYCVHSVPHRLTRDLGLMARDWLRKNTVNTANSHLLSSLRIAARLEDTAAEQPENCCQVEARSSRTTNITNACSTMYVHTAHSMITTKVPCGQYHGLARCEYDREHFLPCQLARASRPAGDPTGQQNSLRCIRTSIR